MHTKDEFSSSSSDTGDKLTALMIQARNLSDYYVCDRCQQLHLAGDNDGHRTDAQSVQWASIYRKAHEPKLEMPCEQDGRPYLPHDNPSPQKVNSFTGSLSLARRTPLAGFTHRDVELVLKRARLLKAMQGDKNKAIRRHQSNEETNVARALRSSLRSTTVRCRLLRIKSGREKTILVRYTFTPKIVENRKDGKPHLLLKTEVCFDHKQSTHIPIAVCPHQLLNHGQYSLGDVSAAWKKSAAAATASTSPSFRLQTAVTSVVKYRQDRPSGFTQLYALGGQSFPDEEKREVKEANMGTFPKSVFGVSGNGNGDPYVNGLFQARSCHRCHTDFVVHCRENKSKLKISVWQDFGPEGRASDLHWQSHIAGDLLPLPDDSEDVKATTNTWVAGLTVEHVPGSVREIYEQATSTSNGIL